MIASAIGAARCVDRDMNTRHVPIFALLLAFALPASAALPDDVMQRARSLQSLAREEAKSCCTEELMILDNATKDLAAAVAAYKAAAEGDARAKAWDKVVVADGTMNAAANLVLAAARANTDRNLLLGGFIAAFVGGTSIVWWRRRRPRT